MAAIDDLTELVETAAAAEKVALSSKWKERPDVTKMITRTRRAAEEHRTALRESTDSDQLSSRWVALRQEYLNLGAQDALPEPGPIDDQRSDDDGAPSEHPLSHAAAAQAERDAVAAVNFARISLNDAALAVLQSRLARIDAGEDDPNASTVDGHVPLHGRNPVSRHGPALAHGLTGEIKYVLARKPRNTMKSLAIALAMGLLYLGFIRVFEWDTDRKWLPYLGLWAIGVVMGGSVCVNAMSFDAMRVRAALDSGERLWHLLVIKNLALLCIVAPIGFVLCALLAWRAGDIYAFYKSCALMICMILLWLGVGNVLSIALPSRDEPIKQRKQSGSLKQFIIAFVVAYFIGYLVNAMLIWRVLAAEELTQRLGNALLPGFIIVVSSVVMWILLTIVAVALSQQPKIRRVMQKEITDYKANSEMKAFAEEAAKEAAASRTQPAAAVSSG
ncbi:MAG: hypothetical protein ABJD68_06800 [Nakamurella sp.]